VKGRPFPAVLKYDGLAAGKGVVIAQDAEEARTALSDMLEGHAFGMGRVVVEDYLTGPEFSFLCFVDGTRVYPMPLSQDHKRAFDGDKGPNTGGMGAYTGLPFITPEDEDFAYREILCKAASAMVSEGLPLSGVLYGGLMKTPQGIKVIEFNARFGDPETEVVLPLLQSDIYDIFEGVATGREVEQPVWSDGVTLGVVLASKGYPGHYEKGFAIGGLDQVDAQVYHMGTAVKEGQVITSGGRVLMVVSSGKDLADAREKVYSEVRKISCDNLFYRNDIAHLAFEKI
jgi:phosphoribosylamine--glycine ligase